MELTSENVNQVFTNCLFLEDEEKNNFVMAKGITIDVGFHPKRLDEHKDKIIEMLDQLPNNFKMEGGGGSSFLNACLDKNGNQWTDLHKTVEKLLLLGLGIDKIFYCLPKEMWQFFPGGMPYFFIKN